jgi:glutathione S-transferase
VTTPVLFQLPPVLGCLSLSPLCAKVQLALRLKSVPYEVKNTFFPGQVNPRKKLPYLVWGERGLEDSTAIVEVIDAEGKGPKLIPEDPSARAEAHLLEDWADESLYWHGVRLKFKSDAGWAVLEPELAATFPVWMRAVGPKVARRQTVAKLDAQGLSRRAPELADRELLRHFDALEARLQGRRWLAGDALTIADVGVAAMLFQFKEKLCPREAAELKQRQKLSALVAAVFAEAEARKAS